MLRFSFCVISNSKQECAVQPWQNYAYYESAALLKLNIYGARLLTVPSEVFQASYSVMIIFPALRNSSCKKYSEIILPWPFSFQAPLSFLCSVCFFPLTIAYGEQLFVKVLLNIPCELEDFT